MTIRGASGEPLGPKRSVFLLLGLTSVTGRGGGSGGRDMTWPGVAPAEKINNVARKYRVGTDSGD